jgi:hypothetical protein
MPTNFYFKLFNYICLPKLARNVSRGPQIIMCFTQGVCLHKVDTFLFILISLQEVPRYVSKTTHINCVLYANISASQNVLYSDANVLCADVDLHIVNLHIVADFVNAKVKKMLKCNFAYF